MNVISKELSHRVSEQSVQSQESRAFLPRLDVQL